MSPGSNMSTVRIRIRDRIWIRVKIQALTLNFILTLTITFRIILNVWTVCISGFSSILGERIYHVNAAV